MKSLFLIGLLIAAVSANPILDLASANYTESDRIEKIEENLTHLWEMVHDMEEHHGDGVHIHLQTTDQDGGHHHETKHLTTDGGNATHVYLHMGMHKQNRMHNFEIDLDGHQEMDFNRVKAVEAHCDMMSNGDGEEIIGHIHLKQITLSLLSVNVDLDCPAGVAPGTRLGLHVHEGSDLSERCNSLGGHFNPHGVQHGARRGEVLDRHVGDWGNIVCDIDNKVKYEFYDRVAHLTDPHSILERSIVLHMGTDDLGEGDAPDSKKTGAAGGRFACCIIKKKMNVNRN